MNDIYRDKVTGDLHHAQPYTHTAKVQMKDGNIIEISKRVFEMRYVFVRSEKS